MNNSLPLTEAELGREIAAVYQRLYELEQRLRVRTAGEDLPDRPFPVLSCRVGDDTLALPLANVTEVVPRAALSPLPEAPPWILGLLNLRGESLPIVDVWARATRTELPAALSDMIVVCVVGERKVGLLVQGVDDVITVDPVTLVTEFEAVTLAPYVMAAMPTEFGQTLIASIPRFIAAARLPDFPSQDSVA